MLAAILGALNPLGKIFDTMAKLQAQKLAAANDKERMNIEAQIATLEIRAQVVAQSQSDKFWSPRYIMGMSVAIYVFKLIVWDTVFGMGSTPDPGPVVGWLMVTVVGFYFVSRTAEGIAEKFASVIGRKQTTGR